MLLDDIDIDILSALSFLGENSNVFVKMRLSILLTFVTVDLRFIWSVIDIKLSLLSHAVVAYNGDLNDYRRPGLKPVR